MRNVEGARVTSADSVEPARFEHLRVDYVYGGDNFHIPKERATPDAHPARSSEARKAREDEYCKLRGGGKTPAEAAWAVDVGPRTRQRYEKVWEKRQAGDRS